MHRFDTAAECETHEQTDGRIGYSVKTLVSVSILVRDPGYRRARFGGQFLREFRKLVGVLYNIRF